MMPSSNAAFLIGLTMVIYAVGIFVQGGVIVFPFPIYPLAFAVFSIIHYSNNRSSINFLLIGAAILLALSGLFVWEIFLNTEQLYALMDSATTDLLFLMSKLLLFIWLLISLYGISKKTLLWAALLLVVPLFLTGLAFDHRGLEALAFVIGASILIFTKSDVANQPVWLFLAFLAGTEWFTGFINNF